MSTIEAEIFRKASSTFFPSSKLFPKGVREDVARLYSFVRVADDYVDCVPQQVPQFHDLRHAWLKAWNSSTFDLRPSTFDLVDQRVIKNIVQLARTYHFDPAWIESFFVAMQADLGRVVYKTLKDTLEYTYGSAEVVGLMMAKIMGLPGASFEAAKTQGRAMQWLNFVRDIDEDNQLGRQYFPVEDLERFGLSDLRLATAKANPEAFAAFIHFELDHYHKWQAEAQKGYTYIPKELLTPLHTAVERYSSIARQIADNPLIVFRTKVLPKANS